MTHDIIKSPTGLTGKKVKLTKGGNLLDALNLIKEYYGTFTKPILEMRNMGFEFPMTLSISSRELTRVHNDDEYAIGFTDIVHAVEEQRLMRETGLVNSRDIRKEAYKLLVAYNIKTVAEAIEFVIVATELENTKEVATVEYYTDGVANKTSPSKRNWIFSTYIQAKLVNDMVSLSLKLSYEKLPNRLLEVCKKLDAGSEYTEHSALSLLLKILEHSIKHGSVSLVKGEK